MKAVATLSILLLGAVAVAGPKATKIAKPTPLVLPDGSKITDAETWRTKRRPELVRLFEDMGGRLMLDCRAEEIEVVGGKFDAQELMNYTSDFFFAV